MSAAARAAGVSRRFVYTHREANPDFARAWDDALQESVDALIGEAYRRAFEGCEEAIYHKGAPVGHIRKYSDTLTIFLLKTHRPEVFAERIKQEVSGPDGSPVTLYLPVNHRDDDTTPAWPAGGLPGDCG